MNFFLNPTPGYPSVRLPEHRMEGFGKPLGGRYFTDKMQDDCESHLL